MEQDQITEPTTTPAATVVIDEALITDEMLVEEISIDGMCGVY